ncbi:SETD4 [Symbiodinium pilosum]|uniref:SETD4 protein n=1 Tax=Symbiodinium pilosum TaxID=2952 RepID=A0A812XKC3_SYMPI|nr:SETD4 [Symbiodinium pilosum]
MVSMEALRARQPKELLQTDVFRTVPPHDLTPTDLADLASAQVLTDPAKVLDVYQRHVSSGGADSAVLIRAFAQLGFLFDPNSFFSTADRQLLTKHKQFRSLAHDLWKVRHELPDAVAPLLLYSMACMDYRCVPLLPHLLDAVERSLTNFRVEALSLLLHSIASLGLGGEQVIFDEVDGSRTRDYGPLCAMVIQELGRRALLEEDDPDSGGSVHDWSRAAFGVVMSGLYDVSETANDYPVLPLLIVRACEQLQDKSELEQSGWAQFFLYQTLYCVDVEKPTCEEAVKRAMPMWIQELLHHRWLDSIVIHAQPQGADQMQRDVDMCLQRTNTQALLNCSFGREWDEQHCWFAGFMMEPKVALECDSMLPLGPGRPRPSGWVGLKSRIARKIGLRVVTLHECFWAHLTEDQKDEQMLRIRAQVGYTHNKEMEQRRKKIRQKAHTYKGIESKRSDWTRQPAPPSDEAAFT